MNRNSRRLSIYIALLLLGTVAAVSLRTAAMLKDLEGGWGYYGDKSLILAAGIVAGAVSLIMLTYGFGSARVSLAPSFSSPDTYIPTGVCAVSMLFVTARLLLELNELLRGGSGAFKSPIGYVLIFCIVFSILSVIHFFLNAYLTERHHTARAAMALGSILFMAFYAALLYFSTELPINSPNKLTDEMAYLAAALFFLFEARISLGREMWRGYSALGLVAAHLCAFSSIPNLIFYAVRGEVASRYIEESVLTFALFLFIISRLILTVKLPELRESEAIAAMDSYAEERAEITAAATERHAHAFAIQITIDDLISDGETLPLIVAEDSTDEAEEPCSDEGKTDEEENEGLDAISIFESEDTLSYTFRLPDPEPMAIEPITDIFDTPEVAEATAEAEDAEESANSDDAEESVTEDAGRSEAAEDINTEADTEEAVDTPELVGDSEGEVVKDNEIAEPAENSEAKSVEGVEPDGETESVGDGEAEVRDSISTTEGESTEPREKADKAESHTKKHKSKKKKANTPPTQAKKKQTEDVSDGGSAVTESQESKTAAEADKSGSVAAEGKDAAPVSDGGSAVTESRESKTAAEADKSGSVAMEGKDAAPVGDGGSPAAEGKKGKKTASRASKKGDTPAPVRRKRASEPKVTAENEGGEES